MEITTYGKGKVQITGGYLIQEQKNQGQVQSIDSKIECKQKSSINKITVYKNGIIDIPINIDMQYGNIKKKMQGKFQVKWRKKIFENYEPRPLREVFCTPQQILKDNNWQVYKDNNFVSISLRTSLWIVLCYIDEQYINNFTNGLSICIKGDSIFYGLPNTLDNNTLDETTKDTCNNIINKKTGLGSSAAVISSIIGAIFVWGKQWPKKMEDYKDNIFYKQAYYTAQLVHCECQQKIGSGFDVASNFFGTQVSYFISIL